MPEAPTPDYQYLRTKGIKHLQQLAGNSWTDHNAHDPGITILEQLAYALTDVVYRANFPIEDLMAEGGGNNWSESYRARSLLTTGPVNLLDWRKLLLDISGVKNVWISPVDTLDSDIQQLYYDDIDGSLNLQQIEGVDTEPLALLGLYQIDYVPEDRITDIAQLEADIYQCFHKHRNLCEDLFTIKKLEEAAITVKGRIEIGAVADPTALLNKIYEQIQDYISPSIRFYSFQEMQAKGYAVKEVMNGPKLQHGYLLEEELDEFNSQRHLRLSDLVHLIMDIKGVKIVHSLSITSEAGTNSEIVAEMMPNRRWDILLPAGKVGRFLFPNNDSNGIQLLQNGQEFQADLTGFEERLAARNTGKQLSSTEELEPTLPEGRDRQLGQYQSILHQFPDLYGIGTAGLAANSTPRRKAQAKQLKAYLSFFDQLLANTFAQLAGMRALFDLENPEIGKTYFAQTLEGELPGFEGLIDKEMYADLLEVQPISLSRQKRLSHHLLARFGERFTDFSLELFENQSNSPRQFLKDYPKLSYRRFNAMNYTTASDKVAGLEQRLSYLLGFPRPKPTNLWDLGADHSGAFYLVEHLLLRPGLGDENQQSPFVLLPFQGNENRPPQKDPYSLQLSFVFPSWLDKFDKEGQHWQFVLKTLREQTPAHLKIYVHQLNPVQMKVFEEAYQDWLWGMSLDFIIVPQ